MSRLSNALKRRAISWAGQLTKLAKTFAPNHLRPFIRSRVEIKEDKTFIIRTTVNRNERPLEKYGSADARAQEYGSGKRATRKGKNSGQFIIITPKTAPFLEFLGTNKYDGWIIRTQKVKHPGIHPVKNSPLSDGYIRPAIKMLRQIAKAELSRDIRQAILGDLRQGFGKSPK